MLCRSTPGMTFLPFHFGRGWRAIFDAIVIGTAITIAITIAVVALVIVVVVIEIHLDQLFAVTIYIYKINHSSKASSGCFYSDDAKLRSLRLLA